MKPPPQMACHIALESRDRERCLISYAVHRTSAQKARIRITTAGVQVLLPRAAPEEKAPAFLQENGAWALSQLDWIARCGSPRMEPHGASRQAYVPAAWPGGRAGGQA